MTAPRKPIDVGNGLVCASFGSGGEWLSFATVHPEAGFVELNGLPLFAPEWRGNHDEVLRYRSWMRREEHAFLHLDAGRATVTTRQDAPRATRSVVQRITLRAARRVRPKGIRIRASGRLGPPTYAQMTELDPPSASATDTHMRAGEGSLSIDGEGGPVIVSAWLRKGGEGGHGSAEGRSDQRIGWQVLRRRMPTAEAWLDWPGDAEEVHLDIACSFEAPSPEVPDWCDRRRVTPPAPTEGEARPPTRPLRVPARLVRPLGRLAQRAASYTRACTALASGGAERAILADHRILPLSWTRDGYWQARLLLATWARGGHDEDERTVADHLRWLFLRCERPDGRWVRSHYADGRRKDLPWRADQQLYPLLELADYAHAVGRLPALPPTASWAALVEEAWSAALAEVDEHLGLIRTDENAADDTPANPYLLSDQVLLWYTAARLAGAASLIGVEKAPLHALAARVSAAVSEHFTLEGPLGPMWAYSVDGRGGVEQYMDANDLPAALAPLWGFCKPADKAWRTTMRFAFAPDNPGFVEGPMGGLGSRRTPGTWPLGDIMAWVAFDLVGEEGPAEAALERLVGAAFTDGTLPEAYDPEGSGSAVRHWFAWPGAALGALLLEYAARD